MPSVASAFITWANPREIIEYEHDIHGNVVYNEDGSKKVLSSTPSFLASLSEQEICDLVLKMWCDSKPGRIGAVTYCISATGFHHLHMVLEVENSDSERFTYKQVQKIYGFNFHIEPTRGSKKEAEDYIYKRGKYTEVGEQVLAMAQHGELKGNQGNRNDLQGVQEMLDKGMTPNEIFDTNIQFRRYEKMIKAAYYRKRDLETPFIRPVSVTYHVGESGTGKTYLASQYVEKLGREKLYYCADYNNGFMDNYSGEEILWLDEYRGQLPFGVFLSYLDKYKVEVHARYSNVLSLWNDVHISSVLPPERIYAHMIGESYNKDLDSYQQLVRRIDYIIYHYKDKDGNYCQYGQKMKDYKDYITLRGQALGTHDEEGFTKLSSNEVNYIQQEIFPKEQ